MHLQVWGILEISLWSNSRIEYNTGSRCLLDLGPETSLLLLLFFIFRGLSVRILFLCTEKVVLMLCIKMDLSLTHCFIPSHPLSFMHTPLAESLTSQRPIFPRPAETPETPIWKPDPCSILSLQHVKPQHQPGSNSHSPFTGEMLLPTQPRRGPSHRLYKSEQCTLRSVRHWQILNPTVQIWANQTRVEKGQKPDEWRVTEKTVSDGRRGTQLTRLLRHVWFTLPPQIDSSSE